RKYANTDFCAVAVTDGNHGRSLAWGARLFGVKCLIYLPNVVSASREKAIADFGAEIVRIDANYDETFARVKRDATENGWSLIQDISTPDYMLCHQRIMEGYTLMAEEMVQQLKGTAPSHVFLQVGCGGMAAAIMSYFIEVWGEDAPKFVLLESINAASTLESLRLGKSVLVGGDHETIMVGIAVGETSYLPWLLFKPYAHSALAISDGYAAEAMRISANGIGDDPSFVSGETGACGLGALLALQEHPEAAEKLGLGPDSSILLINSEGDTDPDMYKKITEQTEAEAEAVMA
ncbi:MAG: diaminopropionate ammonia-lyase, partial [Pseudomonadota bacterium]